MLDAGVGLHFRGRCESPNAFGNAQTDHKSSQDSENLRVITNRDETCDTPKDPTTSQRQNEDQQPRKPGGRNISDAIHSGVESFPTRFAANVNSRKLALLRVVAMGAFHGNRRLSEGLLLVCSGEAARRRCSHRAPKELYHGFTRRTEIGVRRRRLSRWSLLGDGDLSIRLMSVRVGCPDYRSRDAIRNSSMRQIVN
jgi:hypothetical protein